MRPVVRAIVPLHHEAFDGDNTWCAGQLQIKDKVRFVAAAAVRPRCVSTGTREVFGARRGGGEGCAGRVCLDYKASIGALERDWECRPDQGGVGIELDFVTQRVLMVQVKDWRVSREGGTADLAGYTLVFNHSPSSKCRGPVQRNSARQRSSRQQGLLGRG